MPIVFKSGSLNLLEPLGPVQACNGVALLLHIYIYIYSLMGQRKFWHPNGERVFRDLYIGILVINVQGQRLIARSRYLVATPSEIYSYSREWDN